MSMNIFQVPIKLDLPTMKNVLNLTIDVKHSLTTVEKNSLQLTGDIDIVILQELTDWIQGWLLASVNLIKAVAFTTNSVIEGIHPIMLYFSPSKRFQSKWTLHLTVVYDRLVDKI